jgi:multiple sugar transport system permease protein
MATSTVTPGSGPITGIERDTRAKQLLYLIGGVLTLLIIALPLLFALLRSLQAPDVIASAPDSHTFFQLTFDNFGELFAQSNLGRSIVNSLIVSITTAALTATIALFAGYGFSRFRFRASPVLFAIIVLTMMVPFQAILTPLYLQLNAMHLTDSRIGLILFYTTVNLPFGVFVMRNSFAGVPSELEDSGHVDGAGTMRTLFSVMWPLVVPGVATTALYAFLASWTEFLGALTFITDPDLYTLPVDMVNLQQGAYGQVNFGLLAAGAVVAMIPCVVLYAALQRYYVRGLASGAVKG